MQAIMDDSKIDEAMARLYALQAVVNAAVSANEAIGAAESDAELNRAVDASIDAEDAIRDAFAGWLEINVDGYAPADEAFVQRITRIWFED